MHVTCAIIRLLEIDQWFPLHGVDASQVVLLLPRHQTAKCSNSQLRVPSRSPRLQQPTLYSPLAPQRLTECRQCPASIRCILWDGRPSVLYRHCLVPNYHSSVLPPSPPSLVVLHHRPSAGWRHAPNRRLPLSDYHTDIQSLAVFKDAVEIAHAKTVFESASTILTLVRVFLVQFSFSRRLILDVTRTKC
jgi:hypothetical protein